MYKTKTNKIIIPHWKRRQVFDLIQIDKKPSQQKFTWEKIPKMSRSRKNDPSYTLKKLKGNQLLHTRNTEENNINLGKNQRICSRYK